MSRKDLRKRDLRRLLLTLHRTGPGFEGNYTDFSGTQPHVSKLTNENLEADIKAVYEWLTGDPHTDSQNIFSIGFCMGGRVSFLANSILPMKAVVSLYGGGIAQGLLDRAKNLHGPILMFWGGLDQHLFQNIRARWKMRCGRLEKNSGTSRSLMPTMDFSATSEQLTMKKRLNKHGR